MSPDITKCCLGGGAAKSPQAEKHRSGPDTHNIICHLHCSNGPGFPASHLSLPVRSPATDGPLKMSSFPDQSLLMASSYTLQKIHVSKSQSPIVPQALCALAWLQLPSQFSSLPLPPPAPAHGPLCFSWTVPSRSRPPLALPLGLPSAQGVLRSLRGSPSPLCPCLTLTSLFFPNRVSGSWSLSLPTGLASFPCTELSLEYRTPVRSSSVSFIRVEVP